MSAEAPWIALAVDWDESQMWEALPDHGIPDEATDGERLAWIFLLCEAKKKGRGGKVSIRKSAFQRVYRISARAVDGMLRRAQKCGAISMDGETVTLYGWGTYQEKRGGKKPGHFGECVQSPGSALPTTNHPSQTTDHRPPPPPPMTGEWREVVDFVSGLGVAKATECVAAAKAAGCNPNQARNTAEFWRSKQPQWNAGALYERLMRLTPSQSFDDAKLWPPPAKVNGWRQVSREQFAEYARNKLFRATPVRDEKDPNRVRAILETGEMIECPNFPQKQKAEQ